MAQIKIEDMIDHLSHEMKRALEEAVRREIPDAQFDRTRLFKEFRKSVYQKCSVWETIPDHLIRN